MTYILGPDLPDAKRIQERDFYAEVLKHFPGATRKRGEGAAIGLTTYHDSNGREVGYHDAWLGIGGHVGEEIKHG